MPGSVIVELIIRPLAEITLEIAGYATGRVVVPVLSFGRVTVEPVCKDKRAKPRWQGFYRNENKRIILTVETGALLGLFFWFAVGGLGYWIYRAFGT